MDFNARLAAGFAAGKRLCVGIDPHSYILDAWQLPDTAAGAEKFARTVVAAAADKALVLKPQVAFFERFGSAGFAVLERVLLDAKAANIPVIADAKRGDIGSSFAAYAAAWLDPASPLAADALTVVAYQGFGSISPALELAQKHGKGVFVLAATSNPQARNTQLAVRADGRTVAKAVLEQAQQANLASSAAVGAVGVVLGATLNLADYGIDSQLPVAANTPTLPILAPGFGAQGAQLAQLKTIFGNLSYGVIPNESRGLVAAGSAQVAANIAARTEIIGEVFA